MVSSSNTGFSVNSSKFPASRSGISSIAAIQLNTEAVAMMNMTTEEVTDPSVKILVVSALADKATAIEALKKGANGFLCKPFTDRELSDALSELIRG